MNRPVLAFGMLVPLALAACSDAKGGAPPPPGTQVRSDKSRVMEPEIPEADQAEVVASAGDFAWALHAQLRSREGNLIYSPLSITTALAMTYAGARGDTEAQMAEALRYSLPPERLHPAMNWLDLQLNSRGESVPDDEGHPFELRVVNAIWGQTGYEFLAPFLDTIALNYGAGLQLLDFASDPEKARVAINDWVEASTEDKIEDLLPEGSIQPSTRLVLTNAVYFIASWKTPFDVAATADAPFTTGDGDAVMVPMMTKTDAGLGYAAGDGYQLVEVPYVGNELSMVLVLPDGESFETVESGLTGASMTAMVAGIQPTNVTLGLPRFEIELDVSLPEVLMSMGMTDAFGAAADFSGMDGSRSLAITDVLHKAFIRVDEEGTEAAAATAVIVGETSAPPPPIVVTFDRPFLFFLRDRATGAILFVGRVTDPR